MAETKEKPVKEEESKSTKTLDEQIELLDVPKAVDRVFKHPVSGEERTYVQHEMGFLTKIKFFRLVSGTLRLATENEIGGMNELLSDIGSSDPNLSTESFIESLMKLVELAPDFIEESYALILKVPVEEQQWFKEALENLDDDEGVDVLDTFVAQNAQALNAFFTKHLKKLQARVTTEFKMNTNEVTEQESEITT